MSPYFSMSLLDVNRQMFYKKGGNAKGGRNFNGSVIGEGLTGEVCVNLR